MSSERQRVFSVAAVVVAAVLFGMVISGGLNLTPDVRADRAVEAQPGSAVAAPAGPDPIYTPPDFASLAERVVPSVVSVFSTEVQRPDDRRQRMPQDLFHFFSPRPDQEGDVAPRERTSSGSGFFISAEGEILTNNHVVEGADKIRVRLHDDTELSAEIVGRDPATDIALIRVTNPDRSFPFLPFGDDGRLRVGEWVMAVGNPLNMEHTVTVGVVSAMGRALGISDRSFESYIQTDAAINFGNSGGPLVNIRGEAIGVNTAINARGQNLGFAVPVTIAEKILPQLRESGRVVRGYLGISVRNLDEARQEAFKLKSRDGAFVEQVVPGFAAEKAGIKHGDVIVSVGGAPVKDTRDLIDTVSATPPGEVVRLGVIRDGRRVEVKATLDERLQDGEETAVGERRDSGEDAIERLGASVAELSPRVRQLYGLDDEAEGVVITRVEPLSPASEQNLLRGDLVTEANGEPVASIPELVEQIRMVDSGGYLRLYVYRPRAGVSFFAIVKLD